ncbi:hypothetical protein [Mycolicibacterium sp. 120270]|uniref:hypothetical protein n=1 Tax=Mycolicibacterium sp. 120270 TaxID=3090600 RepID=UPI00299D4B4D|nr:hypothetical protein [Mycolicibacterium sp. 120270]MDX1886739.1 hypothetical protein [Mycolicibacterium sp. 120270]
MSSLIYSVQLGFRALNLLTALTNRFGHYSVKVSLDLNRSAVLQVSHVHCIDHFTGILYEQIMARPAYF